MQLTRLTLQSGLLSILLHLAAAALLIFSFSFAGNRLVPAPEQNNEIVRAVTVDSRQVEEELQRLQEIEQAKQQREKELERKLGELQKQTDQAESKRQAEEQRLAELERKKAEERKAREQEQEKLAALKKEQEELERQRQAEQERLRKAEEERKRKAAEQLAEQKRLEEERKRKAAEAARQAEAQRSQDQALLARITNDIYRRVVNNFNISGLPPGLECVVTVRAIPGGEVVNVSISKSSGNEIFDRRAVHAVQKASPLPLPTDVATFERLGLRQFRYTFRP